MLPNVSLMRYYSLDWLGQLVGMIPEETYQWSGVKYASILQF